MTTESTTPASSAFSEWPLVGFTTLAIMGAGLLTTPLVAWAAAGVPAPAATCVGWGAIVLAAGLVVSLAHLGKPLRAPRSASGIGRSRLSAEVAAGCVATALGAAVAFFPYVSAVLEIATAIAGVVFLVTLGQVYALPGQQTWRGVTAWMPVTLGLGFGAVGLAASWGEAMAAIGAMAAAALAADTALLVVRRSAISWPKVPLAPRYPDVFARAQALLMGRFVLVDLLPGAGLLAGLRETAVLLLGLGVLVDRIGFYGLAAQRTTESEIARVEGVIATIAHNLRPPS